MILDDGREIMAENVIWTAGASASVKLDELDLPHDERKGLKWTALCGSRVTTTSGGSATALPTMDEDGDPVPPNAQAAVQEGRAVAKNVLAVIDGEELEAFPLQVARTARRDRERVCRQRCPWRQVQRPDSSPLLAALRTSTSWRAPRAGPGSPQTGSWILLRPARHPDSALAVCAGRPWRVLQQTSYVMRNRSNPSEG